MSRLAALGLSLLVFSATPPVTAQTPDLAERVEHHYAENDGVRIHYVALGQGPLLVMVHGFPDFWYGWRHQMEALAEDYRVVALDQRGYNRSDQPEGVESYGMPLLVGDVAAVIEAAGGGPAVVMGHDWGGYVSWSVAMSRPDLVERLVIVNTPHPRGLQRELATNPRQHENSQYARDFQRPGSEDELSPGGLAEIVTDDSEEREVYREAFDRSSTAAMMHYYRANYPRAPYEEPTGPVTTVQSPVLMVHGLEDSALLAAGLAGTWEWIEEELTLVTLPGVGHWSHVEAADRVNRIVRSWLDSTSEP